jgi:RNA polymerase sigma factor (TIGR02999 family)
MTDVTQILSAIKQGDPKAAEQLLPFVYNELRNLAIQKLGRVPPGQTLQPTALVHEAYLRLVGGGNQLWDSRGHFFAAAAEAMRRILVENARKRGSRKRGGDRARAEFDVDQLAVPELREDLLALDEALDRLAAADSEAARLVQLRYFAGLTLAEAAKVMDVSPRTADRLWGYARAWLHQALEGGG